MERVAVSHARTAQKWSERAEEVSTWAARPDNLQTRWPARELQEAQALARSQALESGDSADAGPSSLRRPSYPLDIVRGLNAYAHRQSDTWLGIGATCVRTWTPFLRACKREVRWPSVYVSVAERSIGVVEEDVTERVEGTSTSSGKGQPTGECMRV